MVKGTAEDERKLAAFSPEETLRQYLLAIDTQARGEEFAGRGIADDCTIYFGANNEDAQRVILALERPRGYQPFGQFEKSKGLLEPSGHIVVQIGNFSAQTYEFSQERKAWLSLHPYGPRIKDIKAALDQKETGQRLAREAQMVIEILLDQGIPFSLSLASFSEFGQQALKVDFPKGQRKISITPISLAK